LYIYKIILDLSYLELNMNSFTSLLAMIKKILFLILLLLQTITFAQLGFCGGSSGAPIFFENFGSGLDYGPPLPAGVTNYTYVNSGFPQDGEYTLFHRTNLIPNSNNWMFSLDHTPDDQPNGFNGKCLIINASTTPGIFYTRTVTGLCSNTTFEFSAWVLNILNASTGGLPINVTFEIWDSTNTILLKTGSTGNIPNTFSPVWNQYGMVFTMPAGETSVILKMRNNGIGGNGNDLAIDDIMFRACGEFSNITIAGTSQNNISFCPNQSINPVNLQVTTSGSGTYFYQWQQSNNNTIYTNILGETSVNYTIPNTITSTTFYRVIVAEDTANINNPFCTTISEVFSAIFSSIPNVPTSNGDQILCLNQATTLSVNVNSNETVNWFDAATGGNLLQANSTTYSTSTIGTYYAETTNITTSCNSNSRVAVTVLPAITASFSGITTICSGQPLNLTLQASNTDASLIWTANSSNVSGFLNGSGNVINQTLLNSGSTSGTVTYKVTPVINGCEGIPTEIIITVNPIENIVLEFPIIPNRFCVDSIAPSLPTSSSNTIPINGIWSPSSINTATLGATTYTFTPEINDCQNIAPYKITITIGNDFIPNFESTISLCSGAIPPILPNVSPNGIIGTWSPALINNTISGTYTFVPNSDQCAENQTIVITIFEPTLNSISISNNGAFSENQTITVIAQSSGDYLYQLNDNPFQQSNIFNNVSPGIYTITVFDVRGCSEPIQEEVIIVNYPKFFTPNNDGFNDFWMILGYGGIQNFLISIYDRYGKLLIQMNESSLGWDGTFNGIPLPASDYWFSIDFEENNVHKSFKSHFSLIR
jgi:gliding motility-associated-like protein